MLHLGGFNLQDIFYSLPGDLINEGDIYQKTIKKLDEHFQPKTKVIYERHVFRQIQQEIGETFETFVIKLKKQAEICKFSDKDEHIIDQIIEKCTMTEIRKQILLLNNDELNLTKIIEDAIALEAVNKQLKNFSEFDNINGINHKPALKIKKNKLICTRCQSRSHIASSLKCPALNKRCIKLMY